MKLDHVSPSQLNTWMRCQRQWYFRYIDNLIIPTAAQLALGGSYHKALETNYRPKVESSEDMPVSEVVDAFADAFESKIKNEEIDFEDEKPGDVKDRGAAMTGAHMKERAPHIQPTAVEEKLTLSLTGDVEMAGIVDLRCGGRVIDHKTGRRAKRQEDLDQDSQATAYMILVPDAMSFSWEAVSATRKGINCQTLTTRRNDEEKKFYLENVYAQVAQIKYAIESGNFVASTEGWHCSEKFCGWYGICKPKGEMMVKLSKPLNEVKDDRDDIIPEGEYSGYVEDAEEKTSRNGNEMLEMRIVLAGNERFNGKVFWYHLVMGLDFSEVRVKRFCEAAGIDTEGRTELKPDEVTGIPVRFVVRHEEYAGGMSAKIHYFIAAEQKISSARQHDPDDDIPF